MKNKSRREFIADISKGIIAVNALPFLGDSMSTKVNKTGYVFEEKYLEHQAYPESPDRLKAIQRKMEETRLIQDIIKLPVLEQSVVPYIKEIHSTGHISSVQMLPVTGPVAELAVAGALGAVKMVSEGIVNNAFCAIRPPGHHAHNSGGEEGFCYYNNVAIAARFAQKVYNYRKIVIIDWDFHHGNSTQDTFYTDPSVLFFSTHNWHAYPGTGDPAKQGEGAKAGLNINVHLDNGASDDNMMEAWEEKLLPKVEQFKPDFILVSAGFDSRKDDLLGTFSITDYCFARITKMALDMANTYCNGRLVSMLEGGYNVLGLAEAVYAHVGTLVTGDDSIVNKPVKTGEHIYINQGTLHFSGGMAKEVTGITVYDISGSVLKQVNPEMVYQNQVDLKTLGLADGYYLVTVRVKSGGSFTKRFSLNE